MSVRSGLRRSAAGRLWRAATGVRLIGMSTAGPGPVGGDGTGYADADAENPLAATASTTTSLAIFDDPHQRRHCSTAVPSRPQGLVELSARLRYRHSHGGGSASSWPSC